MAVAEPPICGICDKPKVCLPSKTERKNNSIWICVTGKTPGKPCDGFAPAAKDLEPTS